MRPAGAEDITQLVDLMTDFYSESGYALDEARAEAAFAALIADPRLGRVWLVQEGFSDVGYVVVTLVFGMEYGGLMAVVDDFYIRPASRGAGLGAEALAQVRRSCVDLGVRAVSVEVDRGNAAALAVCRRTGFVNTDRRHMSLRLAAPSHVE